MQQFRPFPALAVLFFAVLLPSEVRGEPRVTVQIPRSFSTTEPLVALLLPENGTEGAAIHPVVLESHVNGYLGLPLVDLPSDPRVSARFYSLLQRSEGGVLRVSPLLRVVPEGHPTVTTPECSYRVSAAWRGAVRQLADEQLEQLIAIRTQKREVSERRLRRLLTPERRTQLIGLEQEFNTGGTQTLAEDLPLEELLRRLALLRARSINALRGDTKAEYPPAPAAGAR